MLRSFQVDGNSLRSRTSGDKGDICWQRTSFGEVITASFGGGYAGGICTASESDGCGVAGVDWNSNRAWRGESSFAVCPGRIGDFWPLYGNDVGVDQV